MQLVARVQHMLLIEQWQGSGCAAGKSLGFHVNTRLEELEPVNGTK